MIKTLLLNTIPAPFFIFISLFFNSHYLMAQTGKDGADIINTTGVIFNRYSALTASAASGTNTITVQAITDLAATAITGAANDPYATSSLSYGDLIMIIQMQGATIDQTNTSTYGNITAYNNVGEYELQVVSGISGNVITFCNNLTNSYSVGGTNRAQAIRIPRLSALTINAPGTLTGNSWYTTSSTYTGGVIAIEVSGNAVVNGSIVADALGYRGGAAELTGTYNTGITSYVSTLTGDGGEKGEGVAGYEADYDAMSGRYGRGAAGNAGGGGDGTNAAGGGGANGGLPANWNGSGNPDNSGSNYSTAWDLEGSSFHANTSSGGGRGGYTWNNGGNPYTTAPGSPSYGGDDRRVVGGFGGRPLTYSAIDSSLFMGGGGGAGQANNQKSPAGGNGGGIVYLLATGTLSGAGTITANGATPASCVNDGGSGGGGGGAIKLNVSGTISGITVSANGGIGANQNIGSVENEGPGGGGSGGYVGATGSTSIAINVNAGANGTTNTAGLSPAFAPNGATRGGIGTSYNSNTFVAAPATCSALSLTLISFTANKDIQNNIQLAWRTENENSMNDFEVQESTDGNNWQLIGTVKADNTMGTNKYNFNAGGILQTTEFRLKMINLDQSYTYSDIALLDAESKATVYVNGTNLVLLGLPMDTKEIRVYNTLGELVVEKQVNSQPNATIDISILSKGIFYAVWDNGISKTGTIKFVKM